MRDTVDDFNDLIAAYSKFRELGRFANNGNTRIQFFRFLGITDGEHWEDLVAGKMTDEARAKVKWMNGPHVKTLWKVWEARSAEK